MSSPERVTASFWRCFLVRRALSWEHTGRASKIAWRLARMWASENTQMALSAYVTGMIMTAVMNGEM